MTLNTNYGVSVYTEITSVLINEITHILLLETVPFVDIC